MSDVAPDPFIRLDKFLKLVGATGTGGQAKMRVQFGEVLLNGETETRRGKKLRPGDEVTIDDETYRVEAEHVAGG